MKIRQGSQSRIMDSSLLRRLLAGAAIARRLERRLPRMLEARRFREELDREMLCSDRTGMTLTLLLLGIEPASGRDITANLERLAQTACECTRKTDRKGWFRDIMGLRVGLILVMTPPERIQRIIDMIRERYRARLLRDEEAEDGRIFCEVYTYPPYQPGGSRDGGGPTDEADDGDGPQIVHGNGNQGGNGNGHGDGNGNGECRIEAIGGGSDAVINQIIAHEHEHVLSQEPDGSRAGTLVPPHFPPITAVLMDPIPLWKRALDVAGAGAMIVALSPLMGLIALAVKLSSPGPVIFKQERVGYRGRTFLSWKFRSMRADASPAAHQKYLASLIQQSASARDDSEERPMLKLDKVDPRITPVGRLLRMTCLDELPQLFNVLKGEMSLVGPRPCLPYEAEKYQRWHYQRLDTLPGITGLWQVKGKNKVTFRKMIRLDILYARQRSLWLDLKILLETVPAVLREIRDGMTAK